ncbi:hypothetical protein GGR51DRAFT_547550 [Nemania sp. FL0031]|nr:hypothetical protein GGR51DRAFT_547550 [Nemania sp. FL0031]
MPVYRQQDPPSISGQLAAPKRKRADTGSSTQQPTITSNKRQCLTSSLCPSNDDDAKILDAIDARYDVQLQSVISSSKIQKRVSAILRHLAQAIPSPSAESPAEKGTPKTRVSILRAKATEVGKLISIAEIAKREIEKEQPNGDVAGEADQERKAGRWFQYIALGEELQKKQRVEDNTTIEGTVLGGSGSDGKGDEDDEFEVMKTPFERAIQGRPLVRGVPVMSLFLSRSPVEELRKRYGEQTNTTPT